MATTNYSSANHHSVADHVDLTAPNSDWFRLCICRPDSAMASGADILSTAEYGIANSFNIYAFGNTFGLKVNALGDLNVTYTNGTWYLLCAQRSGTALSFRAVAMGTTTVLSDAGGVLSSAVDATTTMRIGRRSDTGANPFDGAISDVMFVNGQTISDADLQNIATGTAIDSFAWFSSRVFWGILENQTALDETGDHTITEEGTLTTATDPVQLVRFGVTIINGIPGTISVSGTQGAVSQAMIINGSAGIISVSGSTGSVLLGRTINGIPGVISVSGTQGTVIDPNNSIVINGIPGSISVVGTQGTVIDPDTRIIVNGIPGVISVSGTQGQILSGRVILGNPGSISISGRRGAVILAIPEPQPESIPGSDMFIIFNNLMDSASLTATTTESGFHVDNIKNDSKLSGWRSTTAADQTITATWGSPQEFAAAGIAFCNLVSGSTVQLKLYTNIVDVTPVYDSGAIPIEFSYNPPDGFSTIGLSSYSHGGGNYFSLLFPTVTATKFEWVLSSGSNPDGYIEASKLCAGGAFTPRRGPALGAQIAHADTTTGIRTTAGSHVTNRGTITKNLGLNLNSLVPVDKQSVIAMAKRNGMSKPVFVSAAANSDSSENKVSYTIFGRFTESPALNNFSYNFYSSFLNIIEV